jgi:hypothetical protein
MGSDPLLLEQIEGEAAGARLGRTQAVLDPVRHPAGSAKAEEGGNCERDECSDEHGCGHRARTSCAGT